MEDKTIPDAWIDKLFNCMKIFYGNRWDKLFPGDKPYLQEYYKTMWKNGLYGLAENQIRAQLKRCKVHAKNTKEMPPHVFEFFRMAKSST